MNKLTNELFLERAHLLFGDKYEYLSPFVATACKIKMRCTIHDLLVEQIANSHLIGYDGCLECRYLKTRVPQKTTQQFIVEANLVHNSKYLYLDEYQGNKILMRIECPLHGIFRQNPNNHLQGKEGCKPCKNIKIGDGHRSTAQEFINQAKIVHPNDEFDYSLVDYHNNYTNIKIICNTCGETFEQRPGNHLQGKGCLPCSGHIWDNNIFVKKATNVHGDKYNYALINYVDSQTKVKIICNICGDIFDQMPATHINKKAGCMLCSRLRHALNLTKTTEEFVEDAKEMFGDQYDYSYVSYIKSNIKVIIKCNKCGILFDQLPSHHLQGKGCRRCIIGSSLAEREWLSYLGIAQDFRQFRIRYGVGRMVYFADGFNPITNTVYEFNGDYWHGNPNKFDPNAFNDSARQTFGELHAKTLLKKKRLQELGYNVVSIWEHDWKKIKKSLKTTLKVCR